jgi:GNAT superfamily N-acetyltransferase
MVDQLEYSVRGAGSVSPEQLDACTKLFSAHYGIWADKGTRVRMSARRLREQCLFNDDCCLALATSADGSLVGHAFATKFEIDGVGCSSGAVSWITQLVVHSDFRSHGVASKLCQMAWDVSAVDGCGIVTSHPYAIRALEKATRRSCRPGMIHHAKSLVDASRIPYLQGKPIRCNHAGSSMCQIDTGFFVDHTDVDELIPNQPPRLGLEPLEAGHEFVAFTLSRRGHHVPTNAHKTSDDEERHGELTKVIVMFVIAKLIMDNIQ